MYLKEYSNKGATNVYENYYKDFVECDLCGHQTRGKRYIEEPDMIYCTSCNGLLLGNEYEGNWD